MTIQSHTVNTYTIDSHPEPEKVYEWIRDNWHDLADHNLQEFVDSLKALAKAVDGTLDYSISVVPDRGEYIKLTNYNKSKLRALSANNCVLTGVCYDNDIIANAQMGCIESALAILHLETEYIYSDEALYATCEANEYYFTEEGAIA